MGLHLLCVRIKIGLRIILVSRFQSVLCTIGAVYGFCFCTDCVVTLYTALSLLCRLTVKFVGCQFCVMSVSCPIVGCLI